jgi:hypothetical protein
LIAPHTNPDPALAANWRLSARPGGNPAATDAVPFPADPAGDSNGNGLTDLVDYALGNDLGLAPISPAFTLQADTGGGSAPTVPVVTYPISLGAEGAAIDVLLSTDLAQWQSGTPHLEAATVEPLGDGRALVTQRVTSQLGEGVRLFVRLRVSAP